VILGGGVAAGCLFTFVVASRGHLCDCRVFSSELSAPRTGSLPDMDRLHFFAITLLQLNYNCNYICGISNKKPQLSLRNPHDVMWLDKGLERWKGVTQGHQKCHHSIAWVWFPIRLL